MHIETNLYESGLLQHLKREDVGSNAYVIDLYYDSQVKVHYQESNPAAHYTDGGI